MPDVLDSHDRPKSGLRKPLVIVGAAALVVTAGVGVAAAASNTPNAGPLALPAIDTTGTPTPTASAPGELRTRQWLGGPGKHAFAGPFGALHGEFTVPKDGGGYEKVAMQRGKVTAVSASQITLKSDDGYTRSYAVTATTIVRAQRDGIAAVKVGDNVAVTATVSGENATATHIVDVTQVKQAMKDRGWPKARPR